MTYSYSGGPTSLTLTNPCLVLLQLAASDGDNVHRSIDSVTIGGQACTQILLQGPGGQNNQIAYYYYKNTTLTGSQAIAVNYHSGPAATYVGAWVFTAGYNTTSPIGNSNSNSSTGSNPSVALTIASTSDFAVIGVVAGASASPSNWSGIDTGNGFGNGSTSAFGKDSAPTVGSTTYGTTMSSAAYAIGGVVIAGTGGGGGAISNPGFLLNLV